MLKISSKTQINSPAIKIQQKLNISADDLNDLLKLCPSNENLNSYYYSCEIYFSPMCHLLILAAMLIADNQPQERVEDLGYKRYRKQLGGSFNPYDYSTFEEEVIFSKDGSDVRDILSLFQDWIANNKDKWKKIFDICEKNNINDPEILFYLEEDFYKLEKDYSNK